jgi:hypothetical protein
MCIPPIFWQVWQLRRYVLVHICGFAEAGRVFVEGEQTMQVRHPAHLQLCGDSVSDDLSENAALEDVGQKLVGLVCENAHDVLRMVKPRVTR